MNNHKHPSFRKRTETLTPSQRKSLDQKRYERLRDAAVGEKWIRDPETERLLKLYKELPGDRYLGDIIQHRQKAMREANAINQNPLVPHPAEVRGTGRIQIPAGIIHETGGQWIISPQDVIHGISTGPSGMGKTTGVATVVMGYSDYMPTLVIDPMATFRQYILNRDRWYVIKAEELRLALSMPPPGADPLLWQRRVIGHIVRVYGLKLSEHLAIDWGTYLLNSYGILNGTGDRYYTLEDLIDFGQHKKYALLSKFARYRESLVTVLSGIRDSTGSIFQCSVSMPLEEIIFFRKCILELNDLSLQPRVLVISILLEWIRTYAEIQGKMGQERQLLLVLEEAQDAFSRQADRLSPLGVSPLAERVPLLRQSGVCLFTICQNLSKLSQVVIGNSNLIIAVGGIVSKDDAMECSKAMGLDSEQARWLQKQSRGQAMIRHIGGPYAHPFTVDLPYIPRRDYPEEERLARVKPFLDSLVWEPRLPLQAEVLEVTASAKSEKKRGKKVDANVLSPEEDDALRYASNPNHLWDGKENMWESQKITSGSRKARITRKIVSLGLVREHEVRIGKGSITLWEVTESGFNYLGRTPLHIEGKGGYVHQYFQHAIEEWANSLGFTSYTELMINGKSIDVVLEG